MIWAGPNNGTQCDLRVMTNPFDMKRSGNRKVDVKLWPIPSPLKKV